MMMCEAHLGGYAGKAVTHYRVHPGSRAAGPLSGVQPVDESDHLSMWRGGQAPHPQNSS